jgi:hypothetical protein
MACGAAALPGLTVAESSGSRPAPTLVAAGGGIAVPAGPALVDAGGEVAAVDDAPAGGGDPHQLAMRTVRQLGRAGWRRQKAKAWRHRRLRVACSWTQKARS